MQKGGKEDNQGVFDYLAHFQVADIQNKGKKLTQPNAATDNPETSPLALPEFEEDDSDDFNFDQLMPQPDQIEQPTTEK